MNPNAIITADIHLRDTIPICRTDDFWEAQAKKIKKLCDVQKEFGDIPILDGGDLFHKWASSPYLEAWAIKNLPENIFTVPGNHEMPSHNLNLMSKSSLSVLEAAGKLEVLTDKHHIMKDINIVGFPYGVDIKEYLNNDNFELDLDDICINVALIHQYVDKEGTPWFDNKAMSADELLDLLPQFDLIITGHNHKNFLFKRGDQLLVNTGSMMRTTTTQKDYCPLFYLWYANSNTVEAIPYPIETDVISIEHIQKEKQKEERYNSFINKLNDNYDIELSFEKNLEKHFKHNIIRKPVEAIIRESMI